MQTKPLGTSVLRSSRLIYGCMRIVGTWNPDEIDSERKDKARRAIIAAWESGYTHFDHADIYCHGACERVFGEVIRDIPNMREQILITTKCGIRFAGDPDEDSPKRYDFSCEHIIRSCEGSLERLGIDTIDVYLLHRPDVLMEPAEVADAFDKLRTAGKVREFGVSNFTPSQIDTLRSALPMELVCHQVQIHPGRLAPFTDDTLDQGLRQKITPTAWSPVAGGMFAESGTVPEQHPQRQQMLELVNEIDQIATEVGVDRSTVTLAWLLRHPSGILPIIGTTKPDRIAAAAQADQLELDREQWYRVYAAAGGPLP